MKVTILHQEYKRHKNTTFCIIETILKDNNGNLVPNSTRQFTGIAKCCPEDEYDYNIGKKLALARAEMKAFDYFDRKSIMFQKVTDKVLTETKEFRDKLFKQYNHNFHYIAKLIEDNTKKNK